MDQADRDMLIRIDERTHETTKQLDTIHTMMNNGGCARGKKTAESLKWLYICGGIVSSGFAIAIGYLYRV